VLARFYKRIYSDAERTSRQVNAVKQAESALLNAVESNGGSLEADPLLVSTMINIRFESASRRSRSPVAVNEIGSDLDALAETFSTLMVRSRTASASQSKFVSRARERPLA